MFILSVVCADRLVAKTHPMIAIRPLNRPRAARLMGSSLAAAYTMQLRCRERYRHLRRPVSPFCRVFLRGLRRSEGHDAKAVAPARDPSGRGRGEVCRAQNGRGVADAFEERSPRLPSLLRIVIGEPADLGVAGLKGRVDHVAGDDGVVSKLSDL